MKEVNYLLLESAKDNLFALYKKLTALQERRKRSAGVGKMQAALHASE